ARGEGVFIARFPQLQASAKPGACRRAQEVGVVARTGCNLSRSGSPVAELESHRIIGMPGTNPNWGLDCVGQIPQFHDASVFETESPGRGVADKRDVVPGQSRQRLR